MSKQAFDAFAAVLPSVRREVEFTASSGRAFVLRELNGAEQRVVDGGVADFGAVEIAYKRLAASIVSINETPVPEIVEPKDFDRMLAIISGSELDELLKEYSEAFTPRGDKLKKLPEDSATNESPTPDSSE